jgi:hypothetical protein
MSAQRGLSLAASPSFALMALASLGAGDPAAMLCSAAGIGSLGGMKMMYALMAVFHAGPWLQVMREIRQAT